MNHSFPHKIELSWFEPRDQIELQSFICKICQGICNNPIYLSCEDFYCKECFKLNDSKCVNTTDKCKEATIHFEDKPFFEFFLSSKRCKCKNNGCNVILSISNLFDHFSICPKQPIKCKFGCLTERSRDEMDEHEMECLWREVKCDDCLDCVVFKDMELHNDQCSMKMTHCTLCNELRLRKDIHEHYIKECEEYQRDCIYSKVNCKDTFKNKDIHKHLETNDSEHIRMYSDFLISTKVIMESIINQGKDNCKRIIESSIELLREAELNQDVLQLKREEIEEKHEEDIDMPIEKNCRIILEKRKEVNNDELEIEEGKLRKVSFTVNHFNTSNTNTSIVRVSNQRGRRRSRGIRRFVGRKTQLEYNNCLITKELFLVTSTVQVEKSIFSTQSLLSKKEYEHSSFHIILDNNRLIENSNWVISPITISGLFYFGVCVKEIVSNYNVKLSEILKGNHGFFGMNSEGYQFHCYSSFKNSLKVSKPIQLTKQIVLSYSKDANQLSIQFTPQDNSNIQQVTIPNVVTYCSAYSLVPCILLTEKNNQLKFEFN